MLTKEQLRSRCIQSSRRYKCVTLCDGSIVRMQSLTRAEQREWRKLVQKKDGTGDPKKIDYSNDLLLAMCLVDDDGHTAFTVGDAFGGMFDGWDVRDTTILVEAAVEHCGLVVDSKDLEDAEKNSDETSGNGFSGVSSDKPA